LEKIENDIKKKELQKIENEIKKKELEKLEDEIIKEQLKNKELEKIEKDIKNEELNKIENEIIKEQIKNGELEKIENEIKKKELENYIKKMELEKIENEIKKEIDVKYNLEKSSYFECKRCFYNCDKKSNMVKHLEKKNYVPEHLNYLSIKMKIYMICLYKELNLILKKLHVNLVIKTFIIIII
jgi:hypothetical protein